MPPSRTTAIGGNAAMVEERQITIKFLLNIRYYLVMTNIK